MSLPEAAPPGSARLGAVSLLAADHVALAGFYTGLLGLAELPVHRSPIFIALDGQGVDLGFHAAAAYELLGIADRKPGATRPVDAYATFELARRESVDEAARLCVALGGRVITPPYHTYYNAWQAVLEDPEGNMFRVNHYLPKPALEHPT